jgi:NAD(P)H dehydrogenase (quinone)
VNLIIGAANKFQGTVMAQDHQSAAASTRNRHCRAGLPIRATPFADESSPAMAKVLVLYYSSYGHIERMAEAVAEGVREAGSDAVIKRVHELVPEEVARKSGYKLDQKAPVVTVDELPGYDAMIFGTPTRYGNMTAQMKNFLDQTGRLWLSGALVGKVGSVFSSTATQHGGQESTILTFHPVLLHLGFIIVGLPYAFHGQMGVTEVMGNSPPRRPLHAEIQARSIRPRKAAAAANLGVETDLTPVDAAAFTAEIFINGQSRAQCRIWQRGIHSSEGIFYAEGSTMRSPTARNEVLTIATGGELALSALMNMGVGGADNGLGVKNLTPDAAAEYLWRRFVWTADSRR